MTIYRCKSCGQLVEPEKNKICPACKADLQNNMTREITTARGNSSHKRRNRAAEMLLRYLIGIVLVCLFFMVALPKYFEKQRQKINDTQQTKNISTNINTNAQNTTGISSDASPYDVYKANNETKETVTPAPAKPEQIYFIKAVDAAFSDGVKKTLAIGDGDIMKFTIKEYRNGDIWINTDKAVFTPLQKIVIENKEYWLLIPVTHGDATKAYFPSAYKEDGTGSEDASARIYASKMPNVTAFFKESLTSGTEMEGAIIAKWTDDELCLQNVVFHYEFAKYKTLQTADGIVFETEDGNRYTDYIQIPHSIVFDQEKSTEVTILRSEIEID